MKQFHPLKVAAIDRETRDSLRIRLDVPTELRDEYAFLSGQHLPVAIERHGKSVRRTYSILTPPGQWPLEIGVRVQTGGAFSEYADGELKAGDTLDVMPPSGRFHLAPDGPATGTALAFAAGSGITPILSIVTTILRDSPDRRVVLFYGNRRQASTMFIDDLYALKNRYPDRLTLQFVFSREDQEFPIAAGRLDADKVRELYAAFTSGSTPSEAFVCGPDTMIDTVTATLVELGMPADAVHAERFGVPRKPVGVVEQQPDTTSAEVTVIMDGHRKHFEMPPDADNLVDAAAAEGIELPYSCKGGVCATCRCHVQSGEVVMQTNYGLEPWEVEAGFVLACQSRPVTTEVTLDYDKT
ncbi:MAG: 2Fe-2S iron-sulfur cluster-binding protein [Pseudomonadota bacterium]